MQRVMQIAIRYSVFIVKGLARSGFEDVGVWGLVGLGRLSRKALGIE